MDQVGTQYIYNVESEPVTYMQPSYVSDLENIVTRTLSGHRQNLFNKKSTSIREYKEHQVKS